LLSLLCGRKAAASRLHVVVQMPHIIRGGNCTGDGRMRHDPFQEKLRPGSTIELGRPIGQRFRPHASEDIAATKRAIDDDGDATLLRERQNFLLRLALHDGIIDLEKIELLAAQNFFYFTERAGIVMRDANVAKATLRLPIAHRRKLRRNID
jgi:hypothetical protein